MYSFFYGQYLLELKVTLIIYRNNGSVPIAFPSPTPKGRENAALRLP